MRAGHQGASVFLPCYCVGDNFRITSSRLKLAGLCRIGNSLKLDSHCATTACDGTTTKARSAIHLSYNIDSSPRSNGSARRLKSFGMRRLVNSPDQTPNTTSLVLWYISFINNFY